MRVMGAVCGVVLVAGVLPAQRLTAEVTTVQVGQDERLVRTLAEDLAQEAFIRAFNAIGSYKTSYKFSNWILKIANNHTIDYLRKRKLDTVSIDGSPHARTPDEVAQSRVVIESRDENHEEYVEHRELGSQIE